MKREVVLTGLGMATSLGAGVETNWRKVSSNCSGLKQNVVLSNVVTADLLAKCEYITGEDRLFDISELAYHECIRSAKLTDNDLSHSGLVFAHSCPATAIIVKEAKKVALGKNGRPDAIYRIMDNQVASRLAAKSCVVGPVIANSAACCGSAQSIYIAYSLVSGGFCDVCIAGGADVIDEYTYQGFSSMRIVLAKGEDLCPDSIRPYGADRSGIALGEGAGFVVLESSDRVLKRGCKPFLKLENIVQINSGKARFGDVSDSSIWTGLFAETTRGSSVDYIFGHGTSTVLGDKIEANAIAESYHGCPVSSTKHFYGHTLSASSVLDVALLSRSMSDQQLLGSGNHYNLDPELNGMCLVNEVTDCTIDSALKLTAGFGGAISCMHLRGIR